MICSPPPPPPPPLPLVCSSHCGGASWERGLMLTEPAAVSTPGPRRARPPGRRALEPKLAAARAGRLAKSGGVRIAGGGRGVCTYLCAAETEERRTVGRFRAHVGAVRRTGAHSALTRHRDGKNSGRWVFREVISSCPASPAGAVPPVHIYSCSYHWRCRCCRRADQGSGRVLPGLRAVHLHLRHGLHDLNGGAIDCQVDSMQRRAHCAAVASSVSARTRL